MVDSSLDLVACLLQVRDGYFGFMNDSALSPAQTVNVLLSLSQVCLARRLLLSLVTPLLERHFFSKLRLVFGASRGSSTS